MRDDLRQEQRVFEDLVSASGGMLSADGILGTAGDRREVGLGGEVSRGGESLPHEMLNSAALRSHRARSEALMLCQLVSEVTARSSTSYSQAQAHRAVGRTGSVARPRRLGSSDRCRRPRVVRLSDQA